MKYIVLLISGVILSATVVNAQRDEAAIRKGNHLYHLNEFENAGNWYIQSIEMNKANAAAYYNLGNTRFRQENWQDAIENYKKAIELHTNKTVLKNSWYNLRNAYIKNEQLEDAIHAYKQALLIDVQDEDVRNNLQKALLERRAESTEPKPDQTQKKQSADRQQQKRQPQQMSKRMIEQYLESIRQKEEEVLKKMQQQKLKNQTKQEKDW